MWNNDRKDKRKREPLAININRKMNYLVLKSLRGKAETSLYLAGVFKSNLGCSRSVAEAARAHKTVSLTFKQ